MKNLRNMLCFFAGLLLLPTLAAMEQQEHNQTRILSLQMQCLKSTLKNEESFKIFIEFVKSLKVLDPRTNELVHSEFSEKLMKTAIKVYHIMHNEYNDLFDVTLEDLKELGLTPFDAPTKNEDLDKYIQLLIENKHYNDLQNFLDCLGHYNIQLAIKAHEVLVTHVRTLVSDIVDNTLDVGNRRFDVIKRWVDDLNVPKSTLKMAIGACVAEKLRRNIFPDDIVFGLFFNPLPNEIIFNNIKQKNLKFLLPLLSFFMAENVVITSLGLSCSSITEIPETIVQLTELEELNLDGSSIGEIPLCIGLLSKLRKLLPSIEFNILDHITLLELVTIPFYMYVALLFIHLAGFDPYRDNLSPKNAILITEGLVFIVTPCSLYFTYNVLMYLIRYINENHILPNQVTRQNWNLHVDGDPRPFLYNKITGKIKNKIKKIGNNIAEKLTAMPNNLQQKYNHIKQSVQNEFNYDVGNIDF